MSFQSDIVLDASGRIDVTEQVRARGERNQLRIGLPRPFALKLIGQDGTEVFPSVAIKSVERDNRPDPYTFKKSGDHQLLQTGSADVPLANDEYGFVLKYQLSQSAAFDDQNDKLVLALTPDDWALPVDNAKISLSLPQGVKPRRQDVMIAPVGPHSGDYIAKVEIDGKITIESMRPLKPREAIMMVLTLPRGSLARPTQHEKLTSSFSRNQHILVGLAGVLLLAVPGLVALALSRRTSKPTRSNSLGPAGLRLMRTGTVDSRSIVATVITLAVKGYLTIEETETGTFMLQRTWKESDLGLSASEKAVATALYADRPSRFFITREVADALHDARVGLRQALQREVERALFFNAKWTVLWLTLTSMLIIGAVIWLSTSPLWALLPAIIFLGGLGLAYVRLLLRPSALPWQLARERQSVYRLIMDAAMTRSTRPAFFLTMTGIAGLVLWIGIAATAVTVLVATEALWLIHRLKGPKHFGLALAAKADDWQTRLLEINPNNSPQRYEQEMPMAAALDVVPAWAKAFQPHLGTPGDYASYKPRWFSGHDAQFDAVMFAEDLVTGLEKAIAL